MSPGELVVQRKRKGKWRQYVNEALLMGHATSETDAMAIASKLLMEEDRMKRANLWLNRSKPK